MQNGQFRILMVSCLYDRSFSHKLVKVQNQMSSWFLQMIWEEENLYPVSIFERRFFKIQMNST